MMAALTTLAAALLAAGPALLSGTAWAQPALPNEGSDELPFGCTPNPIEGTVGYAVANQAADTNAQLWSAAAFAERAIFPVMSLEKGGSWRNRDDGLGLYAIDTFALPGAAWVPSRETGADCPNEFRYVQHAVNLQANGGGFAFKKGPVGLFYAATISRSTYASRLGPLNNTAWTIGGLYLPYVAPLMMGRLNREEDLKSQAADYIVGAQIDLYTWGSIRAGYIHSQGLFLNGSGRVVKLFGSAAIRDFSDIAASDYLRAGLQDQLWGRGETAQMIGATSLFYRSLQYGVPEGFAGGIPQAADLKQAFQTIHAGQRGLGGWVDLVAAVAPNDGNAFVHEGLFSLHTPAYHLVKDIPNEDVDPSDYVVYERGEFAIEGLVTAGRVELPPLPWYGVEGGGRFSAKADILIWMPLMDTMRIMLGVKANYNTPEILVPFPYARDAASLGFYIRLN